MEKSTREPGLRTARLLADAAASAFAFAERDTVNALSRFQRLTATATIDSLTWSLWEPLAAERLKYARLLLRRGEFGEAHRVASVFDHPQPAVFVSFVPASLEIRLAAARALGDDALSGIYRRRLERLGRRDLLAGQ
jgi:hypothetical protein